MDRKGRNSDRRKHGYRPARTAAAALLATGLLVLAGCAQFAALVKPDPQVVATATADEAAPLLEAGDLDAALDVYDRAVRAHPDNAGLLGDRALLALEAERVEVALDDLRTAAELAARSGDAASAEGYGALIEEIAGADPDWVGARAEQYEALPETEEVLAALEFREAMREEMIVAYEEGDLALAADLAEQNLGLAEESFGLLHRASIDAALDLANILFAGGDAFGAETVLALAIDKARSGFGPGHPVTLEAQRTLADVYESQARAEDALAVIMEASADADDGLGRGHPLAVELSIDMARRLETAGDYAGAAELLEAVCGDQRALFGTWHRNTAGCLEQYGILLSRGGDLPGARETLEEVLAIRAGVLGEADPETVATGLDLASLARQAGDHADALARIDVLRPQLAMLAADAPQRVDAMETEARVRFDLGEVEAARELAAAVHSARLDAHGAAHPLSLDALNLIGAIELRAGDFLAAEAAWTEVLDGYRAIYGPRNLATVTAMANLGLVLENQGMYDRAEPLLRSAVEISEELLGQGHPQTLSSMNNLALLHESQGLFDRAEPLYLLPLEVLGSTLGDQHPRTIAVMNNLAFLYMMEERNDQAAQLLEQAYAAWSDAVGAEHPDALKSLNNLGRVQRRMGDLDAAEATIASALEARRDSLGARHVDTQRSMRDLGMVYLDQGRLDEAEALLEETLELNEQELGLQHPYTFETLNSLADVLAAQQRQREAFDLRRTGFERRSEFLDRVLWVTNENAREGYLRLHRPELDAFLSLLPGMGEEIGGREALEVSLQRKGLLLKVSSEIQQIAALGLDQELVQLTGALRDAREDLAALTLSGPTDGDPEGHLERIRDLELRVENLQADLGRASARYRESITAVDAQDLASALPSNGALVDFLVYARADGQRALLAAVLSRDAAGEPDFALIDYPDFEAVETAISDYRFIIQDEGAGDDEVRDYGLLAWEAIWQPVAERLPEAGAVYLVPDGVLNILPFDALVDADGRYLIETTDLHVLSSPRDLLPSAIPAARGPFMVLAGPDYDTEEVVGQAVLAEVRGRRAAQQSLASPEPESADGALLMAAQSGSGSGDSSRGSRAGRFEAMRGVGLTELDSRASVVLASLRAASSGLRGLSFAPLPGAELEGTLIARQVEGSGGMPAMFSRADAEEAILADMNEAPRVLHVATHGFFLEPDEELRRRLLKAQRSSDVQIPPPGDNPLLRAGLAFAGINTNAPFLGEIDTTNDGVLTALEVLSLNLAGTELAVLSACDTGLGAIHEGEGVYGLRRAFQEAGVTEVVTSLWEVSDAGTQALMAAMYERILDGMTPREALRDAQVELMNDPRWGYPYIWAAFMIVGK